jgi:hypothetical protein
VRDDIPYDWKTQTTEWNVEDDMKWKTEDSDKFFYDMEQTKPETAKNSWGIVRKKND